MLNIISGILKPSSGEIKFNDPRVRNNLDKMGYMFQKDYLFPWITVRENVMLGLKIKNSKETFGIAFAISATVVALLAAVKLVLLKSNSGFFAEGTPFWNWNIGLYSWISYLFTSVLQEFLARSMIYGSIRKMFDGKNGTVVAIVLSSLLFGAVHIAHGFMYMAAAMILLGALGGLYEKQRNIWGVAIIHYVLGQAACCLGFLA